MTNQGNHKEKCPFKRICGRESRILSAKLSGLTYLALSVGSKKMRVTRSAGARSLS
jgi:hypothetical protein